MERTASPASERAVDSEKDLGAGMIKIEAGEAKLWGWELWLGMWTTTGSPAAGLIGRAL